MKNLHYLKKFVVMVLAAMMTLSTFAMPTFAADTKTGSVTVSGLENGAEAEAFKIVTIHDNGTRNLVKEGSIEEPTKPKASEIEALAINAQLETGSDLTSAGKVAVSGGSATFNNLPLGMYLVLVRNKDNTKTVVYNPIIVTINVDQNGNVDNGTYDIKSGENYKKYGSDVDGVATAYAKGSTVPFDKVVDRDSAKNGNKDSNKKNGNVTPDESTANGTGKNGEKGDTASRGDVVWFKINTAIPAYADNYTNPKFVIHDQLSSGLTLGEKNDEGEFVYTGFEVYVGGTKVDAGTNTYTLAPESQGYTITFDKAFIKTHGNAAVEVRYPATVDNDCKENFDAETNTAYVTYSHNPGEEKDSEKKTTYHYTFTINGKLGGPGEVWNKEVAKVGVDENGDPIFKETTWAEKEGWKPLGGAVFNLYRADQMEADGDYVKVQAAEKDNAIRTATSRASDGLLMDANDPNKASLDRLDAGVYYLVEQTAPQGYAKIEIPVKVEISASYNEDGTLKTYQIKFNNNIVSGDYECTEYEEITDPKDNKNKIMSPKTIVKKDLNGNTYTWKLNQDGTVTKSNEKINNYDEVADIANSKVGTLPSTGGMGTVLFTVAGAAIMALAIFLLFGGKKKQHQK